MSGTPEQERAALVEHHLGDRLAALIDGELGHDARERVLAHLATCWTCKAEADAQRRVKSVFAATAPPPPSAGLLARLQGLPANAGHWPDEPDDDRRSATTRDVGRATPFAFGLPSGGLARPSGFRIHEPGRGTSRGRRFAFAAAGAFSLAALALSGAVGGETPSDTTAAPAERSGPTTSPASPHRELLGPQRPRVAPRGDTQPGAAPRGEGDLRAVRLAGGAAVLRTDATSPLMSGLTPLTLPLLTPVPGRGFSPSPTPLPSAAPEGPPAAGEVPPAAVTPSAVPEVRQAGRRP